MVYETEARHEVGGLDRDVVVSQIRPFVATSFVAAIVHSWSVTGDAFDGPIFSPHASGAEDAVPLIWPTRLVRGTPPPLLVYLDQNHWIGLAKASVGHPDGGRYVEVLAACRRAKRESAALFPLSGTHYMETIKISDPSRRANLALIMEELSGFATLASRSVVMRLELEESLNQITGPPSINGPTVPLLGWGVHHSVGFKANMGVFDSSDNASDEVRVLLGGARADELLTKARWEVERAMLRGPATQDEETRLRAVGWLPDAAVRTAQKRAEQEAHQVGVLDQDPIWRGPRLRDVISARELMIELDSALQRSLAARGRTFGSVIREPAAARKFTRSMPSTEVAIEMKTQRHRNVNTVWDSNTIFDIDAMALAVPYCDAVVTERHAHDTLSRADLGERMETELMCTPEALREWLLSQMS